MHVFTLFLAFLPIAALGRSHGHMTHGRMKRACRSSSSSSYTLRVKYQGSNFFDGWTFFTGNDPTHGNVDYVSQSDAASAGIAYVQSDGTTVLAVDNKSTVPAGGKRKSVRITTKQTYSDGLFIADFVNMPHGPGVWPAYWTSGPQWPTGGEMDIIENVNDGTTNQYTLHSGAAAGSNCTLDKSAPAKYMAATSQAKAFSGSVLGTVCTSSDGSNAGCAFSDTSNASAGSPFNKGAGGVFAHLWDSTQVSMWRFPRNAIPKDITSGNPDPTKWGVPIAYWSNTTCDISSHFYNHSLIIDTTICGDWAGSAYNSDGHPGTCSDLVANATNFNYAKWIVNYISIYGAASR